MKEQIVFGAAPVIAGKSYATFALWIILTAQLMLQMDFLIVMVALPNIQQELGFTAAALSWVPNAFAIAFGGLLLFGGRLGDMIGKVRAFQIGLIIFVLASLLGGLAPTGFILIVSRILQGIGAAIAAPSVLALITTIAKDEAERTRGLSLFIAVSSVGASAGLIFGGLLTDLISWRWSLLINVPVGAIVLLLIGKLVTETAKKPARLDIPGAVTATLGSLSLVYGFINAAEKGWAAIGTIVSFAVAAFMWIAFVLIEKRTSQALIDFSLFRHKSRVGGLVVMALIVGMHFSMLFFLMQYFQRELKFGPLAAGLAYLPLTATVFSVTHFIPKMISRFGSRLLLIIGSLLVAASFIGFSRLDANSTYFTSVLFYLIVHSVGIALVFTPGTVVVMDGVPDEDAGIVSGVLQMDQQIGGALGIAIVASIYASGSVPGAFLPGLSTGFLSAALISLVAGIVAYTGFVSKSNQTK